MPAQHLPSFFSYVETEESRNLDHNVLGQYLPLVLCQDRCSFDYITQLAHIARPSVLQQLKGGFRAQASAGAD